MSKFSNKVVNSQCFYCRAKVRVFLLVKICTIVYLFMTFVVWTPPAEIICTTPVML